MSRRVVVLCCVVLCAVGGVAPALALCDTAAPNLTGFSFTPTSINTTSASQNVTCNMTVTDDLAGVTEATCSFQSPTFFPTRSCTATVPSSGTTTNGTFSCVIAFPRYSAAGTWTAAVTLRDGVTNSKSILPQVQGLPFQLTVTSDPDFIPPALTAFAPSPTAVTVSAGPQNVTCNMTVTDAKSGVDVATCFFDAPNSDQAQGCSSNTPSSGTRNSGVFSCTFSMPRYADAGTWTPTVLLQDVAGNFAVPAATGNLTVTSSPEDLAAPSLSSLVFNPTSVNVAAAAQVVACTMNVSDATAGVNVATCTFTYTDPINPAIVQSQSCTSLTPSSGTRNAGAFTCNVTIPRYSAGGMWVADVDLIDLAGNLASIPLAQQLTVACVGGDLETTIRFSNHTTMTWDAIAGSTRYNIYRGNLSGLTDTNANHLPDGGYGTCQNSRDPILTDQIFVDTDVPTVGQKGFHYLVSYTSGGVEKGLGFNSFGLARTVTPCP